MPRPDSEFEYNGRLVFNEIFSVQLKKSNFRKRDMEIALDDVLEEYEPGSKQNPASGYEKIDLFSYADEETTTDDLRDLAKTVINFRYIDEDWKEIEEVDIGGEKISGAVPIYKNVDVYWVYPDFVFYKGNKTDAEEISETINTKIPNANFNTMIFKNDFLLWLYYRYAKDPKITKNIKIDRLTDFQTSGDEDRYGKRQKVEQSTNLLENDFLLQSILRNRNLSIIEGHFVVNGKPVYAELEHTGRVYVKVSKTNLQGKNHLHRILASITFLKEISELYERWEQMDPKDKYPPADFFVELYQKCDDLGIHIDFSIKPVIRSYTKKRNEDLEKVIENVNYSKM